VSPLTPATDAAAWDSFVASSEKPHIFQTWGWGELKVRTGWRAHRLVVERDGAWRAGLSLLERPLPWRGRCFMYAPRGPLWAADSFDRDVAGLLAGAREFARSRGAVFLKIDPDIPTPEERIAGLLRADGFSPAPETGGFSGVQPRTVFRLDISLPEEDLLCRMDQKTRYNIRLAERRGVTIRPCADPGDVAAFYKILVGTARRDGFLIRPEKYFQDIFTLLGSRDQAHFVLAEREGRPIAGALALTVGPLCWYAYGASADEGREHMPNHLVQWTLIRWAKSRGCRVYDFRAVPTRPDPKDPLYGLFRFKKGFNGELVNFIGEFDWPASPLLYWAWTRAWPLFKSIRRAVFLKKRSSEASE